MTIIKRLVAKGFKSFAGKTEIVFDKGFNCILGPNGSGKSNVVDALCFVLGKFSAKGMRAAKSANLIYNGGKKGKPSSQAEVSIFFDNQEKKFPVDSKEVKITRIVKKTGQSKYKINDEIRTRQQVVDLLSAVHLSPDGHNIILQGDVIGMIELKPIEKREIIEEISGIASYEEKKGRCLKELEKVDLKLNETEIILTERERNLKELRKDRDQAKKYKEIETNIKEFKATLLNLRSKEKKSKVEDLEKRKNNYEQQIKNNRENIKTLREKVDTYQEKIKEINDKIENEGEKSQLLLRKDIEDLKTTIVKANSRLEVCLSEIEKIKSRNIQLKESVSEINKKVESLEEEKKQDTTKLKELEKQQIQKQKEIDIIKSKYGLNSVSQENLDSLDKEIQETETEILSLRETYQNTIRTKDQLEFKLENIKENLDNIQGKGKSEEAKFLTKLKKESKTTSFNLTKALEEISSMTSRVNNARQEVYKKEAEIAKLQTRQLTIKESLHRDLATRKIIEMKQSTPGIKGSVGELGKVDSKYALALEVAAGSRVNSIVVDSDLTAKKCIQYLKENQLGIVRFLPLNKIKSKRLNQDAKELQKRKDVHGLAIDLVQHDTKYKDVFSYVFGSTIIVEDLSTARKIGIGRIRMITLEGDIIEPSGAMIGGHRIKRVAGGFKEKQIEEKLKHLTLEVSDTRKLIEKIDAERYELDNKIGSLRNKKAELNAEIIKLEKTLNIDGKLIDNLLKEKQIISEALNKTEKELNETNQKLKTNLDSLEKLKIKNRDLKQKLSNTSILNKIDSLESENLKIKEQNIRLSTNLKGIETQIMSMLLPEKDKILKIIKQHEKEQQDFLSESKGLKEMLRIRTKELKQKETEEIKYHTKFRAAIEKRNKISEKIQKEEQNIIRKDEKTFALEERLKDLVIIRAKEIAELEGIKKEFEQYQGFTIKRGLSLGELKVKISTGERELTKIGNVNLRALEVYEEIEREYENVREKVAKLKEEKEEVLVMIAEIEERKKEIFIKNFKEISKNFRRIYNMLSTKGESKLVLENPESPFEGGLDIQVKLHGGKLFDLKSLSGGEKTMAALAFIFAIQEYNPTPFYLLDEVDAALDKKNSELLSKLVKKYSDIAQYIVISHNDTIITEADQIYGVSMQEGISKLVSLKV